MNLVKSDLCFSSLRLHRLDNTQSDPGGWTRLLLWSERSVFMWLSFCINCVSCCTREDGFSLSLIKTRFRWCCGAGYWGRGASSPWSKLLNKQTFDQFVSLVPGDRQALSALLRYHLGEGAMVSGGVGAHTRLKPLQGEKLELGVVSPHFSQS